jgi:hypothetical protein
LDGTSKLRPGKLHTQAHKYLLKSYNAATSNEHNSVLQAL